MDFREISIKASKRQLAEQKGIIQKKYDSQIHQLQMQRDREIERLEKMILKQIEAKSFVNQPDSKKTDT